MPVTDQTLSQQLGHTLSRTDFPTLGQKYQGKVRDTYRQGDRLVLIDRDGAAASAAVAAAQAATEEQRRAEEEAARYTAALTPHLEDAARPPEDPPTLAPMGAFSNLAALESGTPPWICPSTGSQGRSSMTTSRLAFTTSRPACGTSR
mgnify:CR=1 FL=1